MKQKILKLKELESFATEGPWYSIAGDREIFHVYASGTNDEQEEGLALVYDSVTEDREFIIELRNSLPDLLSLIDAQSKIIEVAKEYINDCANDDIDDDTLSDFVSGDDYEAIKLARKVKSEIAKLEKGE